jgi:hypothetical protein
MRIAHRKNVLGDHEWYDTLTNLGSFIGARQWGYSHSELVFSSGEAASALFSIGDKECLYPNFERKRGGPAIFRRKNYDPRLWAFTNVPLDEEAENRINVLALHEIDESIRKGAGYDRAGVMKFVLPFMREHPQDWFCSEFTVFLLQSEGLFDGVNAHTCSPNKLFRLCKGGVK